MSKLILASSSPRRQTILHDLGFSFDTIVPKIDESPKNLEHPYSYVSRMAREKSEEVSKIVSNTQPLNTNKSLKNIVILAADTTIVFEDQIFGKPKNFENFSEMFKRFSGNTHEVVSAFCVRTQNLSYEEICLTKIHFKNITESEILEYWRTGEPCDKAGGYAIQGIGVKFIDNIAGGFSNVIGLPIAPVCNALKMAGIISTSR